MGCTLEVSVPARRKPLDVWARAAFYVSLGFIIPAGVVGGYLLGRFLDSWLRTGVVLTVILTLAGAAAGIVEVIQLVTRMEKNAERDNSDPGAQ